jgi:hypothetical protein
MNTDGSTTVLAATLREIIDEFVKRLGAEETSRRVGMSIAEALYQLVDELDRLNQ